MDNYNLGHLIKKFVNYQPPRVNSAPSAPQPQAYAEAKTFAAVTQSQNMTPQAQMNALQNVDRALYIKDVMQLPKNLNELFYMLQKNISWAEFNAQFNKFMAGQKSTMSQTQAQILAQLQGLTSAQIQAQMGAQLQSALKNLPISANGLINLNEIAALLQMNGKDAIAKLISTMAAAAQQGIDTTQIKDMAKLINACVATVGQNNPAQTVKTLMLIYLPWLPLQDGEGFDLEIEAQEGAQEGDSILTITITTVNYGIIKAVLILETSNSVHVSIECNEEFPKDELNLRIENEQKNYSMQSVVSFSTTKSKPDEIKSPQAKINMANTNEINPYLLLMAHTIIRHTIEIDKNAGIGSVSHTG